jgi:preprotein translocase subunit SecD
VEVRARLVVTAVLTILALTSCSDDSESGGSSDRESTDRGWSAAPSSPVEFRPVWFSDVGPTPTCASTGSEDCPPERVLTEFDALDCSTDPGPPTPGSSDAPLVACAAPRVDETDPALATKFLLRPARIVGGVVDAEAEIPEGQSDWAVTVQLDGSAADEFRELTEELVATQGQVAIVLDGTVISAPTVNGVIDGGLVQISGQLTAEAAQSLADRLEGQES